MKLGVRDRDGEDGGMPGLWADHWSGPHAVCLQFCGHNPYPHLHDLTVSVGFVNILSTQRNVTYSVFR